MKKTVKILCLILTLTLSVTLLAGCGNKEKEQANSLPDVPEAIEDMRDDAMELTQKFAKDNEGLWVERVSNLVTLNPESVADTNTEYVALTDSLKNFSPNKISNMFIVIKNEDGTYHKAITTEKKAKWLEEISLPDSVEEALDAELIVSDKSGHGKSWPVYSPLYNTAGECVAYVCLEYAFDELEDYPEWDRNSEKWHGIE